MRRWLTFGILAVLTLGPGCAVNPDSTPSSMPSSASAFPSRTPVRSTATPEAATSSLRTPLPSAVQGGDRPSSEGLPPASPLPGRDQQYRTPGVPDPTAAGPLSDDDLPNPVLGFRAVPAEATESEFNPNGTWVHAIDGATAGFESWPRCGPREAGIPAPTFALAGRYADAAARPGNALVLQFASTSEARRYYEGYLNDLSRCPREEPAFLVVTQLQPGGDSYVARRRYASAGVWSEYARVRNDRVLLLLLAGEGIELAELSRGAEAS